MELIKEVQEDWFSTWFNSPYYHLLYKNRDYAEARKFIDNLDGYFQWKREDNIMDLACGKGRHSIYLNQKGASVTGLDLSEQNIRYALSFANARLHFAVHDMREIYAKDAFTHIVNLFTSFGYFTSEEDNLAVFHSASESLRTGGYLLIDYLNPDKVISELVVREEKVVEGIHFHISKSIEEGYIIKNIVFKADGISHHFQERVQILREEHFRYYFDKAGFQLETIFGDYDLNPFDDLKSDRMIFVVKKPGHVG
jgi:SAM-dependent methyltransferase